MASHHEIGPKTEAVISAGLMSVPGWVYLINEASIILSFGAALIGFVLGCHSVYLRFFKKKPADPSDKAGA